MTRAEARATEGQDQIEQALIDRADAAYEDALAAEMLAEAEVAAEAEVEPGAVAVEATTATTAITAATATVLDEIANLPAAATVTRRPSVLAVDLTSPDRFLLAALPPAPIQPGQPSSPFRRCSCLGTLPGRACPSCNNTRWLQLCPTCQGDGLVSVASRAGATFQRKDRCGFCMGRGSIPAKAAEVTAAQLAWAEFEADGGEAKHPFEDAATGKIRREAKLPLPLPSQAASRPAVGKPSATKRRSSQHQQ